MWRILTSENLRPKCTSNLFVGVDEANGECGASGPASGLHALGPHDGVPCRDEGRSDDGCCIHAAGGGEGLKYCIAGKDNDEECEWEEGSR
jgi:hypothetical protein